ncbi:MAG: helix-turn-helix transcriptional regulator [Clostridiales bacterium]|nr:helix-turn-helix transcriptional regulator [Clostridiales bacterium]
MGLSQRAFAETVGIDPRYLANIENTRCCQACRYSMRYTDFH